MFLVANKFFIVFKILYSLTLRGFYMGINSAHLVRFVSIKNNTDLFMFKSSVKEYKKRFMSGLYMIYSSKGF